MQSPESKQERWKNELENLPAEQICTRYTEVLELFKQFEIPVIYPDVTVRELIAAFPDHVFRDRGTTKQELYEKVKTCMADTGDTKDGTPEKIETITIVGGHDKNGQAEQKEVCLHRGEVVCVVGKTGSGKSRFLEDIEYIADGDTVTGRRIWMNGRPVGEKQREAWENHFCAYLSQTMNYVMVLTCAEFLQIHISCHTPEKEKERVEAQIDRILACANSIAGEPFTRESYITQLSGGQSRALMIADIAYISDAPVVLIDEPENAGIDCEEVIRLLAGKEKIVLISTHDPLIALSCEKRIVIRNGGIAKLQQRSACEKEWKVYLEEVNQKMKMIRGKIRNGENIMEQPQGIL